MVTCPNCGSKFSFRSTYNRGCVCLSCRAVVRFRTSRCPNCGNRLSGRAMYGQGFACPSCHSILRFRTSGAASLFMLLLLGVWISLIGVFGFLILPLIPFIIIVSSTLRTVEIAEPSTFPTIERSPLTREPSTRIQTRLRRVPSTDASGNETALDSSNGFRRSLRAGNYCIYCGASVLESTWKFCSNCGASLPEQTGELSESNSEESFPELGYGSPCMVCGLALHHSDLIAYCPHCGNGAHMGHMLEWLHVRRQCPVCGETLTEREVLDNKRMRQDFSESNRIPLRENAH